MKHIPLKLALIALFTIIYLSAQSQTFEGWINYRVELLNPDPEMFDDKMWQELITEQFGEKGFMEQKYFYKNDRYLSEINAGKERGFQVYNPKDGLLYSWQLNSDTAMVVDSKKNLDHFISLEETDKLDTILGIPCRAIIVKSFLSEMTVWYNSERFKADPNLFKGHLYGHWEQILNKTKSLPLKVEQKSGMTHLIQLATDFKETSVDPKKFEIPEFKEIIESPF